MRIPELDVCAEPQDNGDGQYTSQWMGWARIRLTVLEKLLSEAQADARGHKLQVEHKEEQLKAAEVLLERRRQTSIYCMEPGTKVGILGAEAQGTISQTIIGHNQRVYYKVAYWKNGSYHKQVLPAEELLELDVLPSTKQNVADGE